MSTTHVFNISPRPAERHCVLSDLGQITDVLKARGGDGCSLLTAAAEGGNEAVFVDACVLLGGKVSCYGFHADDRRDLRCSEDLLVSLVAEAAAAVATV